MSMRDWLGRERRKHSVVHVSITHELGPETRGLIEELVLALGGAGMNDEQFNTIVQMLQPLAPVPAQVELIKEELSLVHGIVSGERQQQEQVDEAAEQINKQLDEIEGGLKPKEK